ncbi:MAG: hypothetical protein KGN79_15350 [Acidobacteriota bacterium]|nr:hypothetical protein [Acidobacteriota bacterium]
MYSQAGSQPNQLTVYRFTILFAVLHCAFFIASLIVVPALAPGARIPNPFGPNGPSLAFLLQASSAIRVSAFLQILSACTLAALAATLANIGKSLRPTSAASMFTLVGGVGSALLLALTALFSWALACPGCVDPGPAFRSMQFVPFLLGGPGWAGFFAIFLAGVSALAAGKLPSWLTGVGYFLAVISALATLVLITIFASPCLPIARFLGFLWLILVAILLLRKAG